MPATAGPISSAPLKMKEFKAMALGRFVSFLDDVDNKSLTRGDIEGADDAEQPAENEHMPDRNLIGEDEQPPAAPPGAPRVTG